MYFGGKNSFNICSSIKTKWKLLAFSLSFILEIWVKGATSTLLDIVWEYGHLTFL